MTNNECEKFVAQARSIFHDVYNIPFPTICCIDGPALGGGLELSLNCDIRIASEKSILGLPETSLAIIPGATGT